MKKIDEAKQRQKTGNSLIVSEPNTGSILDGLKLDSALKLAKKNAKNGALGEACSIYREILRKFPNNKIARRELKHLSDEGPNKPSEFQHPTKDELNELIKLYSNGQFQSALERVELLCKRFSRSAILFNIRGAIMKELKLFDLSIKYYSQALLIEPDYADAYSNMSIVLRAQGKFEDAIEACNKSLSIKPDHVEAYNNLGLTLQEQGKLGEQLRFTVRH